MGATTVSELSDLLRATPQYQSLLAAPGAADGLTTPAAAWVAGLLAADLGRPLLAVAPHESDAFAWMEATRLFCERDSVFFPAPPLTPYHEADVSLGVRVDEAVALDRVRAGPALLVATPRALFRRLPALASWEGAVVDLAVGAEVPMERLVERLTARGYQRTDLVSEVGELAVRGGVVDVFGPGEAEPVRLDLAGDTVEAIHRFSTESQRSVGRVERVRLLPLVLFEEGPAQSRRLGEVLAERLGRGLGREAAGRLEDLRRGVAFPGWQALLPLAEEAGSSLVDWLGDPLVAVLDSQGLLAAVDAHAARLEEDRATAAAAGRLALPAEELEIPAEDVRRLLHEASLRFGDLSAGDAPSFGAAATDLFHGQLPRFARELDTARARRERLFLVAPPERQRWLSRWCDDRRLPVGRGGVELLDGVLERGFRLPPLGAVFFGEHQLFPRRSPAPARARRRSEAFLSGLRDLKVGDYVVHQDHGIGQFVALRAVSPEESAAGPVPAPLVATQAAPRADVEVMEILYAEGRRLLMPLSRLDRIERYSGVESIAPRLDRLGGSSWNRTRERVKRGMQRLAGDLLELYAERRLAQAPAMPPASDLLSQFEAAFEWEETTDQEEASRAIQEDLSRPQPMDRLLCGDVGFGKTEVAMRAAFRVVEGGWQVAVLAPTTILADQHRETFGRRFEGFPVRIDMVSRFRSAAEIRGVRARLAAGEIDILVGTHRLLSKDIEMPRLGLLVVDEEQRFGVAQKERLREIKKNVHVLAMSATPVPRTLQLSLAGVRDLSVIESPPRDRMAVETAILPLSADLVREAIEFELDRGGQVYFVYNRVEGIEEMARWLREVVPGVRLTIGHGQMDERELAERMHAFKRGEHDLLLATTIIENGIDIPNVNTLLVHRADRFGLAQLYQLRGRVGRGSQLAYCYLLLAPDRAPSPDARERLAAIREFTELGAGFRVAARDLEIRGAGNLLGAEQSGHIASVGLETYLRMLDETVRELRGEAVAERFSAVIDLPVPMAIPTEYLDDGNLRMEVYRKMTAEAVPAGELLQELRDRFGPPPPEVVRLVEAAALKRRAEELGVQSVSMRGSELQLRLRRDSRLDVGRLVEWIGGRPGAVFSPSGVLTLPGVSAAESLGEAARVLEELGV